MTDILWMQVAPFVFMTLVSIFFLIEIFLVKHALNKPFITDIIFLSAMIAISWPVTLVFLAIATLLIAVNFLYTSIKKSTNER